MQQSVKFIRYPLLFLVLVAFASGCATNPESLQAPQEITCVDLKEPLSYTAPYGLLNIPWTTKLERGPYWSEKVDEKGTFYRAPPGGVSITGQNGMGVPGQGANSDGGFYVPNNPNEPITIYRYFSTAAVPVQVPSSDTNCSTVGYAKDPSTSKVSLLSFGIGGAVGGAVGGIIGRGVAQGSNMTYGQAAGAGAAGGLVGGLIVASIINADVGKIIGGIPIRDAQFMEKLRVLVAAKVRVKEVQLPAAGNARSSATAATGQSAGEK